MSQGSRFDLTGPLPSGTTVIEASAGTGKTYAIAGLATRYLAEGVAELSQLMLVTFGRAATQELRERTRARLVGAAAALADPRRARTGTDPLLAYLASGDEQSVRARRLRLLRAVSDFDAATIATTHGFCQQMLDSLGTAGEREPDAVLVESVDDLAEEVISDLYLAGYRDADEPLLPLSEAREAAWAAIRDAQATLAPADAPPDTVAGRRVAFAEAARDEVRRRKRRRGIRDFDDLLVLLRDTLAHPVHGPAACRRVRERYRVVLVDEFQDTDPVQWEVLRLAFHGSVTMILVGDPKQAIYAFRGAEVLAYLDAVRAADHRLALETNWRSDAGLLTALEQVYAGAALGHPEIMAHPVAPAISRRGCRGRRRCGCATSIAPGAGHRTRGGSRPWTPCAAGLPPTSLMTSSRSWRAGPHWAPTGIGVPWCPATSRCSCAIARRSPSSGTHCTKRVSRAYWPGARVCSRPRRRRSGCGCCRGSSTRIAPPGSGWPR
ncbi:UvrD-helicase domain-containing protein [Prauserella oleivorans]